MLTVVVAVVAAHMAGLADDDRVRGVASTNDALDGEASLSDRPPPKPVVATTTTLPPPAGVAAMGVVGLAVGVAPVPTPTVRVLASFDYGVLDLDAGVRFDLPSRSP